MGKTATMTTSEFHAWYLHQEKRYELLGGVPEMSPAPHPMHQKAEGWLYVQLHRWLADHPIAAVLHQVEWWVSEQDYVCPDIVVLRLEDEQRLLDTARSSYLEHLVPLLCVEILSPSSRQRDLDEKRRLYEKAGVREYWVVEPLNRKMHIFQRQNDEYQRTLMRDGSFANGASLPGFTLDLDALWAALSPRR